MVGLCVCVCVCVCVQTYECGEKKYKQVSGREGYQWMDGIYGGEVESIHVLVKGSINYIPWGHGIL